ncbi:MAG: dihydrodipicolinate synthase/N-acetylneuraminate lyase [Puniceicoccaceae bacterium 5H]|nr:MAG: dihydrodipicolinate synthase/N-acetylneuraminate lyase [Puniceicoccaceae bacterium 5H]
MSAHTLPLPVRERLFQGVAIPAHPLALTARRRFDERRQRALTRYYLASGAGGLAVGVHTTQFEIREPSVGLYEPVLALAAETMDAAEAGTTLVRVAGIAGPTAQAVQEAEIAAGLGYHLGLVSLAAFAGASDAAMVAHLRAVAEVMPVFGFYLQPSVGGRALSYAFWRQAAEIENLVAIKLAPFNRYASLDVARAVVDAGRADSLALYTGNDDNILLDLLTTYRFGPGPGQSIPIRGGLLGQWAVWTQRAVEDFQRIRRLRADGLPLSAEWMTRAQQWVDVNAVVFDVAHGFRGCITGIHEILRRQGLLEGIWTLNPEEGLSPGQAEAIDRIYRTYPELNDDAFIQSHLDAWLR